MASKILVGVSAVVVVMVLFMAGFGASYIAHPKFTVVNESTFPVVLTVGWDGKGQHFGNVGPGQRVKFSVNAKAEMTLLAKYPNGNTVVSPSMYLTSGSITKAKIFETHIEFE
jgi:hypothetical protein